MLGFIHELIKRTRHRSKLAAFESIQGALKDVSSAPLHNAQHSKWRSLENEMRLQIEYLMVVYASCLICNRTSFLHAMTCLLRLYVASECSRQQ